ncbi:MAG: class I adenylate-forming enzyme family protein, partial [Candidatus Aenigmatarchaeota archaeon]
EILVEAPWMFLKYLNLDTCSYFIDGKFRTGDVGELRDGYLWITGRKKYLINRGGVKISPFMIERIVATTSFFKDFAIIGVPDEIMGEKIVCVYVSDEKGISPSNKRTINLKIKEKLGRDFTIDMFVEVPEIPRTTSGKVDIERIKKILAKMRI